MAGIPGMTKAAPMGAEQRQRIWQSMRRMPQFTAPDLVATAEAGADNVRRYIAALFNSGYLEQLHRPNGYRRRAAVWRLRKDTGPVAPRVRWHGGIYDANLEPTPARRRPAERRS